MDKIKQFTRKLYKWRKFLLAITILIIILNYTRHIFLPLEHIEIIGTNHVNQKKIVLPNKGQNMFNISLQKIYNDVTSTQWVKSATITRIFPDRIKITIEEDEPFAIWNYKFLIDQDGKVIDEAINNDRNLISIIGEDANITAFEFIQYLDLDLSQIKELEYITKRRWNITFKQGLTVKLPDKNTKTTWEEALKIIEKKKLLSENTSVLDMRVSDKFFIKYDKLFRK